MARARTHLALLALALTGCSGGGPPAELSGLWSAGPAACAAGVGVQFGAGAIAAIYDRHRETLFDQPTYQVESQSGDFRVRILYPLPTQPGGARSAGAHGELMLVRDADGGLRPSSHTLVDPRTGSVRMRIVDDPAMSALTLRPCGRHHGSEGLRGRGET